MLNISWGNRIAILYIGFVLLIGTMVAMCMNQKIDLVSDDYYARELIFQDKINETNNANALPEKISHSIQQNGIQLQFPLVFKGKIVSGEVLFFRPSDATKDFKSEVHLNKDAQQLIGLNNLNKGMYKMQINWTTEGVSYFSEETIVIP